ncbi:MAG: holo-ACP synthase [Solirubrobacteraceae bacterium]
MIGIDLLEIARLEQALARRPRLAGRLFTAGEREYAATRARPAQHLAARFCAKEAVFKALRLEVLRPLEIEVTGGGGETGVVLHGAARERADDLGVSVEVSLSHSRLTAAAVAVLR